MRCAIGRELQSWFQVLNKRKLAWPQLRAPPTPLYLPAFLYPQGLSLGLQEKACLHVALG